LVGATALEQLKLWINEQSDTEPS